jgi:AhpD family alkylhydroperoxidase
MVGAVYADILQTYSAYNLTEPHLIYQLMGLTPEHLAASWPRSRYLYAGTQEDENKSLSRLSLKDKHLVTLAVSAANNCEYCVRIHTARLHQLGTTTAELLEALSLVSAASGLDVLAEGTRAGDRPTVSPAASDRLAAECLPDGRIGSDQVLDILALSPDILKPPWR